MLDRAAHPHGWTVIPLLDPGHPLRADHMPTPGGARARDGSAATLDTFKLMGLGVAKIARGTIKEFDIGANRAL